MTMPHERYRAILKTEQFLRELLVDPDTTTAIKESARWCLRHYPSRFDLDTLSRAAPDVLQSEFKLRSSGPTETWN
ncbi:hypothetical protein UFOVP116_206 [uncultured Caudovirales phage]|uniref:Uncharacterized protein n=1 Tax=uncultured Caudovirales phage TaxID=2100421 RepID=A0A6J5L9H6_9CAUD|nr:hypothetical protein UFOVP116_206 [uncultured Caudovirales phage]